MSLDACIDLGFQHQPALDAARASLSASETGMRSLDRLIIPRLFRKDLPVRRRAGVPGVDDCQGGLDAGGSRKRATPSRGISSPCSTFGAGQRRRLMCSKPGDRLVNGPKRSTSRAIHDAKITELDLNAMKVQMAGSRGRNRRSTNGMLKALAALREAMGLKYDYPLEIAAVALPSAVWVEKSW